MAQIIFELQVSTWLQTLLFHLCPINIFISHEKNKSVVINHCPKFAKRLVALFFQASRLLAADCSNCSWIGSIGNCLCLGLSVQPAEAVSECCPKSLAIAFAVKTLIVFWNSLQESGVIARWQAGACTSAQTWTLPPDQVVVKVLSAQNPWINCVEFSPFFGLMSRAYHTTSSVWAESGQCQVVEKNKNISQWSSCTQLTLFQKFIQF